MPRPLSYTFCPLINSPTPSCCTTTWHRMDRVVLDSAVRQAACNRSPKAASPATLTHLTGPTENCSCVSTFPPGCARKSCKETRNTLSQSSPRPTPQVLISLLGPHFAPFLKLVVHVRYLCIYIYIYCICNSRILNVVATFYF